MGYIEERLYRVEDLLRGQEHYRSDDGATEIWNVGGVSWLEGEPPRRLHRCTVQSSGYIHYLDYIERCRCGATKFNHGPWFNKNQTRDLARAKRKATR